MARVGEIATTQDGRDITRGYIDPRLIMPPQDTVLDKRGAGDYDIYEEVARDDQVEAVLSQRKNSLIAKDWSVIPGGESAIDQQAADFISDTLSAIKWDDICYKMLSGVFYGYSVAECIWRNAGNRVELATIKVKTQRRFAFKGDGSLVLITSRNPLGEKLPPRKFWHFSSGGDSHDDPYGLGLAHWLYWPVFFKRNNVKFWLIFLEKYGMPTAVGKYPSQTTDESDKIKLLEALEAIQVDSGITIPESMTVELLEATRGGTADYTELYDRMNQAISKVVLGHSSAADATPGRLGGEDLASNVILSIVKADSDLIHDSFNGSVVKWLTDWNFPGAAYPKVTRDMSESVDLKAAAERDSILYGLGYRLDIETIKTTYGDGWEESQEPIPTTKQQTKTGTAADDDSDDFADDATGEPVEVKTNDGAGQDELDQLYEEIPTEDYQEQLAKIVKPVFDAAESDPNDLMGELAKMYPEMNETELGNAMSKFMFVADTWGRLNDA